MDVENIAKLKFQNLSRKLQISRCIETKRHLNSPLYLLNWHSNYDYLSNLKL